MLYSRVPANCVVCQASDEDIRLNKCPICFRLVCDNCAVRSFGRMFCVKTCSQQFFFGDDDE
jgi:hypothetical protein